MQINGGFIEFLGEHLKLPRSSYSAYLTHSLIYKNESMNMLDRRYKNEVVSLYVIKCSPISSF